MTNSDSLAGKIAVITGGARGIGHQIARAYAAHGATVVLSDIDESAAKEAASTVPGSVAVRCDVRDQSSVAELFERAADDHGKIDIAVANAGIATVSSLLEMSFDTWRTMMSINLDGVFNVTQAFLDSLRARKGRIVNIASIQSFVHLRTPPWLAAGEGNGPGRGDGIME